MSTPTCSTWAGAPRAASRALARAGTREKNHALEATAQAVLDAGDALRAANREDLEGARSRGIASALIDRLELTPARIAAMAEGLREIAALPDPVGEVSGLRYRPSGIQVGRMRVPLGVIGIVYESRPNVTADAAGLCLKAGNATILRGDRRPSVPTSRSRAASRKALRTRGFRWTRCRWSRRPTGPRSGP